MKFPSSYLEFGHGRDGIIIQQDGARAHIKDDDDEFAEAVAALGVNVSIYTQPANSPDLNINDLGFFHAIQALYSETAPDDEFDLIKAVEEAYDNYPPEKINYIWLSLMGVCNEIIKCKGDNSYKLPHMGKPNWKRKDGYHLCWSVLPEGTTATSLAVTLPIIK